MTGYQEILTDPSYAGQIITFTFPHIGVVGTNEEDIETVNLAASAGARGAILHAAIGEASNHRATRRLDEWLRARGIIGLTGVDTRALTAMIRESGMPNAVIAHNPEGAFDRAALLAEAAAWPGMDGMDLVPAVTTAQRFDWDETSWTPQRGYGRRERADFRVVAVDYGIKRNILRLLSDCGCEVTVMPATATAQEILALKPDGVFLSNGPGDPAETGKYAVPTIKALLETRVPVFGICLGHQMLGLAVGARTVKMPQGHHGADHPVKDFTTDKVEIVSMNHEFAVDPATLPANAEANSRLAVRRLELRHRAHRSAGVLSAIPPRSLAGAARQPLPVPPLRRPDGRGEGGGGALASHPASVSASPRMKATQAEICETATNSSGLWACSIEPGPQTMVGRPAAWKCPASVAKETAPSALERVSLSASDAAGLLASAASAGTSTSMVVSIVGPADEAGQARQRDLVDKCLHPRRRLGRRARPAGRETPNGTRTRARGCCAPRRRG